MSTAPGARAVRIVSEQPSPRFLGLTAAERNERVVRRATSHAPPATSHQPPATLIIPPGVIITPALIAALPPPIGTWLLSWDPARPPIVWNGDGTASPGTHAQLPDGAALDVSSAAARRRSAWRLLRASGKPTDGWLSRHVHRKISRACSYALLRLGLSANHATFLTFLAGVPAAWLMAQTTQATMIAGALLVWFASIADGIDGEMARLTLSESARGEQLDTAVDHATHLLGFAGVLVGWWRQGIGPAGWALAAGVAIGLPATLLWSMRLVRRAKAGRGRLPDDRTPFFVDTKPIELAVADAARATGAPMLRLASTLWLVLRREVLALTFFLVSLVTGERAVYPILLAGGVALVAATLVAYREPIALALEERSRV